MKTTEYGAAGAFNEFGQEKPAKDAEYLHTPGAALTGAKLSLSDSTVREMVQEFHRLHGYAPSRLHLSDPAGHYRARGLSVKGVGIVVLDILYGAPENRVE